MGAHIDYRCETMKKWQKYEQHLLRGDWHVHTNYTDGKNTIFEYCEQAERNGLELIAFTEHVRRNLDYSFGDFVSDVYAAKDKFDFEVLAGCEVKVLDGEGTLDVSDEVLKECEIVLGAFHRFEPTKKEAYLTALKNMLSNPDVDIWAHPTLFTKKNKLTLNIENIRSISRLSSKNDVLIEINKKYNVPDGKFLKTASTTGCKFVKGSDAHQISELLKLDE